MAITITRIEIIKQLKSKLSPKKTQSDLARELGISCAYLSDVLNGRRDPGPKLLDQLKLEQRITYKRKAA